MGSDPIVVRNNLGESKMHKCPICQNESCTEVYNGGYHKYSCDNCGSFMLDIVAYHALTDSKCSLHQRDPVCMSRCESVMLERNLKGLNDHILISFNSDSGLFFAETGTKLVDIYPVGFFEKLERGYFNLVRAMKDIGFAKFQIGNIPYDVGSLLFLDKSGHELPQNALALMVDEGWMTHTNIAYAFTVKGMDRFEAKAILPEKSHAFLAMWFGVPDCELYQDAVEKAVIKAGYQVHVVSKEEYNGLIMDKVINLINDSTFVVADISALPELMKDNTIVDGVRGGVYWEAGYAAGQKKQVILTCLDDARCIDRIHFDMEQYNQIRWKNVSGKIVTSDGRDLVDAIEQRILATVGKGRHTKAPL